MPEETTPETIEQTTEVDETTEPAPETVEETAEEKESDLPEWARKRLTKANAEAANYRTRLRETEKRLEGAKSAEEFESALAEVKAKNAELEVSLLRADAARKFNLPDDLAERLRGTTKEELEADAKALQKYASTPEPEQLSGGLDPSDDSGSFDPVKASRAARKRRW